MDSVFRNMDDPRSEDLQFLVKWKFSTKIVTISRNDILTLPEKLEKEFGIKNKIRIKKFHNDWDEYVDIENDEELSSLKSRDKLQICVSDEKVQDKNPSVLISTPRSSQSDIEDDTDINSSMLSS